MENKASNKKILKDKNILNIVLLIILAVILFSITLFRIERNKFNLKEGDVADEDIRAINEIEDINGTKKKKLKARKEVPKKYRTTPSVQINIKNNINGLFNNIKTLKKDENLNLDESISKIKKSYKLDISKEDIIYLYNMDDEDLDNYLSTLLDTTNQILGPGILEEDLEYEIDSLDYTFENLDLTDKEKEIGINILKQNLKPNKFIDEVETRKLKDEAERKVEPVIIKENEIIVSKGEVIDEYKLKLIKESGLLKNVERTSLKSSLGTMILILLSLILMYLYIESFNKDILSDGRYKAVLSIVFLVILLSEAIYSISAYLLPISAGALLISVLVEPQLAIIVNMIMVIYLGFLLRLDISIIFMSIIGSSLGVVTLKDQRERANILSHGFFIGITNVFVMTAFGLIKQNSIKEIFIKNILVFSNGILAVIITIGSLPLWEKIFKILTPVRLQELSNPNQPLIKKLLLEAPGTYHHSLMVGNLSEAAAEVIGANPLLTRVGSYYHDIGKMASPYYFKENQFGMDNPHDKISPEESAKIILNHTVAGEKMAKEYKLPEEIISFTTEHHGTTKVAYFYYEAKKNNENINIKDFTYKGKKPQSKETAIVMLADSTEAAVRSIDNPDKEKIENMINKVIDGKVQDGQMNECNITSKDISLIKETFLKVLMGMYHDRIAYPDDNN